MSECCSAETRPRKHRCPVNGLEYSSVSRRTLLHHLKQPWARQETPDNFYFCDDPDCDVVYFAEDDSIITQQGLRTPIGLKNQEKQSTLCYCFGVSYADAQQDNRIRDFVVQQTKSRVCDCEIRNPSGQCCLKEFPGN